MLNARGNADWIKTCFKFVMEHTCQLLRIFRKLYVILRAYGRRAISLGIFIFTKSLIFLRSR